MCMTCGLRYLINNSLVGIKEDCQGKNVEDVSERGCEYEEEEVGRHKWCTCRIPNVSPVTELTLLPQRILGQAGEKLYMGRPYAVLTKFFSNMYRRRVINKKLLRYLSGDKHDEAQAQTVTLRRHRTECSIRTGYSSSEDSGEETYNVKDKKRASSVSSETSESSTEGGVWVHSKLECADAAAPISKMKNLAAVREMNNLQKWRYHGKELRASASSSESGVSTDGSNPYGYVRYYNPEDSNLGLFKSDEVFPYPEIPVSITSKFHCHDSTDSKKACKSASSNDSFYSVSHEVPLDTSQGAYVEWNLSPCDHSSNLNAEGNRWVEVKRSCSCNIKDRTSGNFETFCKCPNELGDISNSKSFPILSSNETYKFTENTNREGKTVHSSILTIPANPIVLPSILPSAGSGDFSDSTTNICNKTIYEASTSSDEIANIEKACSEIDHLKKAKFPFKTKPDVAYYVSSCSGDEMGNDGGDYYESQRKQTPGPMTVSHSEPNLYLAAPSVNREIEKVKYSSHFVQLVCDVEYPGKVCHCESFSHRSSDSGLADIVHHLEFCPLRSETPGVGRGSCLSHCSHSSQISGAKLSRCESSCQVRPFSPDSSGDTDSLFPTPLTTPCASNPVSYTTDSITSLYEPGALRFSPSSQNPLLSTSFSGNNREDNVFRSGLYAHWWMKASVCPKLLALDRLKKDYLRFRADKKPEVPPKPKFLKPSYHIKRGGVSGAVVKPSSRSASTQTGFPQGQNVRARTSPRNSPQSTRNTKVLQVNEPQVSPVVKPKKHTAPSHLSIRCSPAIPRDPSFESQSSQVSQITVIPQLHHQNLEMAPEFQEQLRVPNRQCLSALRAQLKGSQESSSTSNNSCYELSSLHSFNECCSRDGNPPHLRDSSEGLDVDFQRRASSHSLCTGVGESSTFTSSVYCKLQPFESVSVHSGLLTSDRVASSEVSGTEHRTGKHKPSLPPKPKNLTSWPIQRSKSLPKLPLSSLSTHSKSKVSFIVSAGSFVYR